MTIFTRLSDEQSPGSSDGAERPTVICNLLGGKSMGGKAISQRATLTAENDLPVT